MLPLIIVLMGAAMSTAQKDGNDLVDQKTNLEKIQGDLERGKKALDSLKAQEISVQKRITDHDQKIASDKTVVNRLNRQLRKVRGEIKAAEERLVANTDSHERARRRFLGDLRQFYLTARGLESPTPAGPNDELILNRKITYLTALVGYESGSVKQASDYLAESVADLDELSSQSRSVQSLKKDKETATALSKSQRDREQKALAQVMRKKTEQADRVLMLQQAAAEMEMIITRLEQQRQARQAGRRQPSGPSVFATLEGHLLSPFRGRVVTVFGESVDPITNLKSFSPGISIKGRARADVSAVAAGVVAYVGELRGYGDFIIIDHDEQYYSTYAGLADVVAAEGRLVQAGTRLASAAANGIVRFELRQGRKPLDPVKWIRIDSF